MKKYRLIFICIGLVLFATVLSCENTPPGASTLYSITINETDYAASATYNFGLTESESIGKTITLVLKNTGNTDITISAVTLSDAAHYSVTTPALPQSAAAGSTVEASVNFKPQASGILSSTISITVDGFAAPFVLNLTGEGNYAPTVKFGIEVSDAGNTATNGFYERAGFLNDDPNRRPNYTKTGTVNYYCYSSNSMDNTWVISNSQTTGFEYYNGDGYGLMTPPESGWLDSLDAAQPLKVTRYDITGTDGYSNELLTANYKYYDADGDAEDSVSYQWYVSDAENGTYTAISGETGKTYTPSDMSGKYIKVEVTPAAKTGIIEGAPVMSSPTIKIINPLV